MIFHYHLHPYFSTWRRGNRHLATVPSFALSGRKCYTCIPIWSSICNLVIVYIYIDNQCLTFPWFGFSPWLFDTIQIDSLWTLVFFLWVQRCIGLDLEMVFWNGPKHVYGGWSSWEDLQTGMQVFEVGGIVGKSSC